MKIVLFFISGDVVAFWCLFDFVLRGLINVLIFVFLRECLVSAHTLLHFCLWLR